MSTSKSKLKKSKQSVTVTPVKSSGKNEANKLKLKDRSLDDDNLKLLLASELFKNIPEEKQLLILKSMRKRFY